MQHITKEDPGVMLFAVSIEGKKRDMKLVDFLVTRRKVERLHSCVLTTGLPLAEISCCNRGEPEQTVCLVSQSPRYYLYDNV